MALRSPLTAPLRFAICLAGRKRLLRRVVRTILAFVDVGFVV
jgi:hypothetical protein